MGLAAVTGAAACSSRLWVLVVEGGQNKILSGRETADRLCVPLCHPQR